MVLKQGSIKFILAVTMMFPVPISSSPDITQTIKGKVVEGVLQIPPPDTTGMILKSDLIKLEIFDLKNDQGVAAGTTVIFSISNE